MEGRDHDADVRDRRPRALGLERGLHRADYDLPNDTAYAETCASVALIFWAQRMLHLDLDGRYADVMELALYNGALARTLPRRDALFLRQSARERRPAQALGLARLPVLHDERVAARRLDRRLLYSTGDDGVAVHLYGGQQRTIAVGGAKVRCGRSADYPWSGKIRIEVEPETPASFDLKLRIPGWANGADLRRSTASRSTPRRRPRLCEIRRLWTAGRRRRRSTADAGRAHLRPSRTCAWTSGGWRSGAVRWSIASRRPTTPAPTRGSSRLADRRRSRRSGATSSAASSPWLPMAGWRPPATGMRSPERARRP